MKAEYINPFFNATVDVFRIMLDLEVERGKLGVAEDLAPSKDASAVIGITGDLSGSILYSFPQDMVLEMVRIMSGMSLTKMDSFVGSALGEVANIISGNAMTNLSATQYFCDIVPPQVLIGKTASLSMATEKALVLPVITSIGDFEITISLRENK